MSLTGTTICKCAPGEKPCKRSDEKGLFILIELLAELPIRAHRVIGDQQLRLEQVFRRDRRAPRLGVLAIEFIRNGRQRRGCQFCSTLLAFDCSRSTGAVVD